MLFDLCWCNKSYRKFFFLFFLFFYIVPVNNVTDFQFLDVLDINAAATVQRVSSASSEAEDIWSSLLQIFNILQLFRINQ